jgi:DNA-binding transcriptional LysR family regulator
MSAHPHPFPIPVPEVDLHAWRQFLGLAEELHFGRAAARLGMTQPPLTQALQRLERALGLRLLERTRRSVALTPAGSALVEPVRQLLLRARALPGLARDAAEGRAGTLRLGFVSTVGFGPLPGWLRGFRRAHPGVALELREATGDVQVQAFDEGELDAGLLVHAPGVPPGARTPLLRLRVAQEPLWAAVPAQAPVDGGSRWLLAQPLVIFPRATAPSLYDGVLALYHRMGAAPAIAQEAIQMQTIVNLVSAGLGVALVPRAVTRLRRPGVAYRPLPPALARAAPRWETSLAWPAASSSPAVARFVSHVRAALSGGRTSP